MCITVVCLIRVHPSGMEMHWSAAEAVEWKKIEGCLYSLGPMSNGMGSMGYNMSWKLNEQLMITQGFEVVECNLLPKVALWSGKWS